MRYFLSIDYSGSQTKAILFDETGQDLAMTSFSILKIKNQEGYCEVDLNASWQAVSQSIQKLLQDNAIDTRQIAVITCIGHGKGLYLLDRQGRPLGYGVLPTDSRAEKLARSFEKKQDSFAPLSKQQIYASHSPVLLRWLKEEKRSLYNKIGHVLAAKDFIRYQLTGKINQDYSDAWTNYWISKQKGQYDPETLAFFGIEEMLHALPKLVDSAHIVGGLTAKAAQETGLMEGTPVLAGLSEIEASTIGLGLINPDTFGLISGSWNINCYPKTFRSKEATPSCVNSNYLVQSSSPASASNLEMILKMLMTEELIAVKTKTKESIYELLETFLKGTDATYSSVLFFPFLFGSNVTRDARACFMGLTTKTTKSHLLRAVYEGITFAHKQHVESLIASKGSVPKRIRMTGCASHSRAWVQLFADVLGLPIETLKTKEVAGLGGAIIGRVALDRISLKEAVSQMVTLKNSFCPNASQENIYQEKYHIYQDVLQSLTPAWKSLAKLKDLKD
ncbi:FGGY-family carbohydrate kinase [Streptococcus didelphis]